MAGEGSRSGTRILVVEDDPGVGRLTERILSAAGYLTTLATSVDEAVAAAREADFELVLSDLVLGRRDGHDLADELLAIDPRLPVVFMTGFGASPYGRDPSDPVLAKPFAAAELLARVEQALATGR